jgi:hypothetical protein
MVHSDEEGAGSEAEVSLNPRHVAGVARLTIMNSKSSVGLGWLTHVSTVLVGDGGDQTLGLLFVDVRDLRIEWPDVANPAMSLTAVDMTARQWEAVRFFVSDAGDHILRLFCAEIERFPDAGELASRERRLLGQA